MLRALSAQILKLVTVGIGTVRVHREVLVCNVYTI